MDVTFTILFGLYEQNVHICRGQGSVRRGRKQTVTLVVEFTSPWALPTAQLLGDEPFADAAHPADLLGGHPRDKREVWHVTGHYRPGCNHRPAPDYAARH